MPLDHMDRSGVIDPNTMSTVVFPMADDQTKELIPCSASDEALQDIFGPATEELIVLFEDNRYYIESAASAKYDRLGKPKRVDLISADF